MPSASKLMKIKGTSTTLSSGKTKVINRQNAAIHNVIEYVQDTKNLMPDQRNLLADSDFNEYNQSSEAYKKAINYVENTNKCYYKDADKMLISGLNTDNVYNAVNEFIACEKAYHAVKHENCPKGIKNPMKKGVPNEAFHIIQSFKGKEISPEKVHELGLELGRRLVGTSFKAVITTHLNTNNYHNHIIISAYAADGIYKFRDSWNIGKKLQALNDEISLENGIEIITDFANEDTMELDDSLENIPNKNIHEHKAKVGTIKKQTLMNDIILSAKSTNSWEDYKKQMELKGYEVIEQRKSVKYRKLGILGQKKFKKYNEIRDNRLGKQFTKAAINRYFKTKDQKNIYKNLNRIHININHMIPSRFIGKGRETMQNPLLFRFVGFLINIVKFIIKVQRESSAATALNIKKCGDRTFDKNGKNVQSMATILESSAATALGTKEAILNQLYSFNRQLVKVREFIEKQNIQNIDTLKAQKQITIRRYITHKRELEQQEKVLKEYDIIENAIETINKTKVFIEEHNISDADLLIYNTEKGNILENKAKANPMRAKTKSRLYKALHNSGYKLKYNFKQLSESMAKEIIYFITEINKGNSPTIPESLYTMKEYIKLKNSGNLEEIKYNPFENNLKKPDLSKYSNEEIKTILEYKKAKQTIISYGYKTEKDANDYILKTIIPIREKIENLREEVLETKELLSELNILDSFFDGSYKYNFKPFSLIDNIDVIDQEFNKFKEENQNITQQLITLKSIIEDPTFISSINTLDDENIIIAPAEIIALSKSMLALEGIDKETSEIINMSKSELKTIITDFIKKYDIDKNLKNELKTDIRLELERQQEEQKTKDKESEQELKAKQEQVIENIIKSISR